VALVGIALRQRERHEAKAAAGAQPGFWSRALDYGREAQIAVYVIHQLPIIVLGYYVVQWPTGALIKFVVIALGAVAFTWLAYEFLVRRWRVMRFLFGLRVR